MVRDYIKCTISDKAENQIPKLSSFTDVHIEDSRFAEVGELFVSLVYIDLEKYDASKLLICSTKKQQSEKCGMPDKNTVEDGSEQQESRVIQVEGCVEVPYDVTEDVFLYKFIRFF